MAEYTVKDNQTGKTVTFRWNAPEPPTDADMEEVFSAARVGPPASEEPPVTWRNMPAIEGAIEVPPGRKEMAGGIRTVMETGGMVGGGLLGLPLGPGGVMAGETAGYVAGKRGASYLLGEPQEPIGKDIGEGALFSVVPRGLATAGKAAFRQIPKSVADRLYRSAAKLETVLKPQSIRKALDAAFRTKATVSPAGQGKLATSIEGHLNFIDDALAKNQGKYVDKAEVISKIDELASEFIDMPVARPYLGSLGRLREQFILEKPDKIPVERAQAIKRKAWAELQGYFKKTNRLNATRQTIVGEQVNLKIGQALREGIEREVPEIAAANKALGGELELQAAIDRAVGRISNKDIISIMDPLMVEAFQKETWGPGLKAMAVRKLLEWPKFKSYLAIEIANSGKIPLLKARPGATAVIPAAKGLLDNR